MRCRIIPRLDIKGPNLIKSVNLEGLRILGDPQDYARRYYDAGACELLFVDVVASLYGRNNLGSMISRVASELFIPLTVTGGIRSVEDVSMALQHGADKVGLNTAAVKRPELITEIANRFGAQCLVLSVEAKRRGSQQWEAFTDNGREPTGLAVTDWVQKAVALGAGEVLLTSIDREGTREGFDIELVSAISAAVNVPIIASGGLGKPSDAAMVLNKGHAQAVAVADFLHYGRGNIDSLRREIIASGLDLRRLP